jgi:hypothetical protein
MAKHLFTTKSDYDTIEKECLTVRTVSSTSSKLRSRPSDVTDILGASYSISSSYVTLLQVNSKHDFLV